MSTLTAIVSYKYGKNGAKPNTGVTRKQITGFKFQSESALLEKLEKMHPGCSLEIKDLEWK